MRVHGPLEEAFYWFDESLSPYGGHWNPGVNKPSCR